MSNVTGATPSPMLSTLNSRMEAVCNVVSCIGGGTIHSYWPNAVDALTGQGIDLSALPEPPDQFRHPHGFDEFRFQTNVKRIANASFTKSARDLLALPREQLPAKMRSEELHYSGLMRYVGAEIIDEHVADELIKAGIASFERPQYTSNLTEELKELKDILQGRIEGQTSHAEAWIAIENALYAYMPNAIRESLMKAAPSGDPYLAVILEYQGDAVDRITQILQLGIERRIYMEMLKGEAPYSVDTIEQLHRWGFISDAAQTMLQGLLSA